MYECFHCGKRSVIWNGDFDLADCGYEGVGVVHQCTCTNCGAEIEYVCRFDEEENECEENKDRFDAFTEYANRCYETYRDGMKKFGFDIQEDKMIIKYCDRCKQKIEETKLNGSNIYESFVSDFPKYDVTEYLITFSPQEKHLCSKCSKDLYRWLRELEGGD